MIGTPSGTVYSLYGHRVSKVRAGWQSKDDPFMMESDLPRETRVLTDLYLDTDEPATGNRVGFLDIEVDTETGFPNIDIANKEIISIALTDKFTGIKYVFILDDDGVLDGYSNKDVSVFNCHS